MSVAAPFAIRRRRPALALSTLVYHAAVRNVRKSHGNAVVGLLLNIFQTVLLVVVFYVMFEVLGMRSTAVRGDYVLYLMSGIFLFMTHAKTLAAVAKAEGPASPMMQHAPMNTVVSIGAAALGALYLQVLSLTVVLFVYHAAWQPITIDRPAGAMAMLLLAWASGAAIGVIFLAIRPWSPEVSSIGAQIYGRANMIASGKMFLANTLGYKMLRIFDWNPLFHTIDQARGFTFINYNPHHSSIGYAVKVTLVCLVVGLMAEFYTRQRASASWQAKR